MDTKKAQELLAKHREGTLNPEEQAQFDSWYNQLAMSETEVPKTNLGQKQRSVYDRLLKNTGKAKTLRLWPRIAAAASILLALSFGGYFLLRKPAAQQSAQLVKQDVPPGHNQATLTLANGQKIVLTKGLKGLLAKQGQTAINATANNIVYQAGRLEKMISYNTLSTARGEQSPYPLVLTDGTKVWLNAESSITFPTAFNGKERIVKITGEAFFEVVHNDKQPFKVQTDAQTIEDIGTQFNVNAYSDEPHRMTTLVEGSIKVNGLTLRPGQQTDGSMVSEANVEKALAWKNGEFRFSNDNIVTIMRQLSRWYDIDVSYQGMTAPDLFSGKISRSKNISAVLHMIEKTKRIHFKIEGRRVTVIQ